MEITIDQKAWDKLKAWVSACPIEMSSLGIVHQDENRPNKLHISDVYLPKQECHGASTDMDQDDVGKLVYDLDKAGVDPVLLRLWQHSHVDMDTAFSSVDDSTIDDDLKNDTFLISLCMNKRGEYSCRVDVYKPLRLTVSNVLITPVLKVNIDEMAIAKAEIEEKVKRALPVHTHHYGQGGPWPGGNGTARGNGRGDPRGLCSPHNMYMEDEYGDLEMDAHLQESLAKKMEDELAEMGLHVVGDEEELMAEDLAAEKVKDEIEDTWVDMPKEEPVIGDSNRLASIVQASSEKMMELLDDLFINESEGDNGIIELDEYLYTKKSHLKDILQCSQAISIAVKAEFSVPTPSKTTKSTSSESVE